MLPQLAVPRQGKNSWQSQATVPAHSFFEAVDPTPHDPPAFGVKQAIRRVVVPVVQDAGPCGFKRSRLGVKGADEIFHLAVWRNDQDPAAGEFEKVGALDVRNFRVGMPEEHAQILPLRPLRIFRLIHIHDGLAALRMVQIAAANHERPPPFVKNEWIAPVVNFHVAVDCFGQDRVRWVLLPINQVFVLADRGPLFGMVAGGLAAGDAGVENHRLTPAVDVRAARENVLFARLPRRPERDRQMFPMDQVAAARVAPVHVSPVVAVRIVLIEQVVITAVKNGAVGIVHPVGRRQEMVARSARTIP